MDLEEINCSDCDAPEPRWASINRGVLLCDECCSVHRQLGRYVSQIKHIQFSNWRPTQLAMFNYLAKANVNRFWEHTIYEKILHKKQLSKNEVKPKPNDPLPTKKREFIIAKYSSLSFMQKPQKLKLNDLNQQLHASVRTGVLETSLQLLALGANPNVLHPSKGTSAVHHACENDQIGQLELLIIYGGDICSRDLKNRNAFDIALKKCLNSADVSFNEFDIDDSRSFPSSKVESAIEKLKNSWTPLLDALVNSFYEIPDVFSQYLFKASPNHQQGIICYANGPKRNKIVDNRMKLVNGHFYLPLDDFIQGHDVHSEKNHHIRSLKNQRFQYLCTDVHDETERRSLNEVLAHSNELKAKGQDFTIPFLPINTEFSQVRNQARQKLARLNNQEFRELLIDTLLEISVRLNPIFPPLSSTPRSKNSTLENQNVINMFDNIQNTPTSNLDLVCSIKPVQNSSEVNTQSSFSFDDPMPTDENLRNVNGSSLNNHQTIEEIDEDRVYDDPVYDQVAFDAELNGNQSNKTSNSPAKPSRALRSDRVLPHNNPYQDTSDAVNTNHPVRVDEVTNEIVQLKQANLELKERLLQMQSAKYQYETKFGDLESEINQLKRELIMLKMEKNNTVIVNNSFDSGNSFKPGMKASNSSEDFNNSQTSMNKYKISEAGGSFLDMDNGYTRSHNPIEHVSMNEDLLNTEYSLHAPNVDEPIPAERKISTKNPLYDYYEEYLDQSRSSTQNDSDSIPSDFNNLDEPVVAPKREVENTFFKDKTKTSNFLETASNTLGKTDKVNETSIDETVGANAKWEGFPDKKAEYATKSTSLRDQQPGGQVVSPKHLSTEQLSSKSSYSVTPQNEDDSKNPSPSINRQHSVLRKQIAAKLSSSTDYASSSSPTPRTTSPLSKPPPTKQPIYSTQRTSYGSNNTSYSTSNGNHPRVQKSILKNPNNNTIPNNNNTLPTNGFNLPVRNVKNSSDAVVQAVELIIGRIRNLLDVANGRSIGSPVQLSRAIQTAVNEILLLFPLSVHSKGPFSSLTPSLTLLRTSSISLSQYCQRQTVNAEDKFNPQIKVEVIIKHAHEIARSAKEILSLYQTKNLT